MLMIIRTTYHYLKKMLRDVTKATLFHLLLLTIFNRGIAQSTYASGFQTQGITIDSNNDLYAPADYGSNIYKCSYVSSGTASCSIVANTGGYWGRGIAVDSNLNLYVSGGGVNKFTPPSYGSTYVSESGLGLFILDGKMYFSDGINFYKCTDLTMTTCTTYFTSAVSLVGDIYGFAFDKVYGHMCIADRGGYVIKCCTSTDPASCYTYMTVGFETRGVAFDSYNSMYVGDISNSRVLKYSTYSPPSQKPTSQPSRQPSRQPTSQPTSQPSAVVSTYAYNVVNNDFEEDVISNQGYGCSFQHRNISGWSRPGYTTPVLIGSGGTSFITTIHYCLPYNFVMHLICNK